MGTTLTSDPRATPTGALTREDIDQQLARVLASHQFCHSARYPALLGYLVQQVQAGNTAGLKERALGIEVFHRTPDYDTNTDPVVRVTAAEVRKRLAQYYQEPEHFAEPRIELPLGSYVPRFLPAWQAFPSAPVVPQSPQSPAGYPLPEGSPAVSNVAAPTSGPAPAMISASEQSVAGATNSLSVVTVPPIISEPASTRWGAGFFRRAMTPLLLMVAVLAGAVCATVVFLAKGWADSSRSRALHQLWEPLNTEATPLLFIVGDHSLDDKGQSLGIAPNHENLSDTVLTQMNHRSQVPLNDLISLDRIHAFLTRNERVYRDAGAGEANLGDLRSGPVVLFAGFDNRWSVQLSQHLRYQLQPTATDSILAIVDSHDPNRRWSVDFEQSLNHFVSDYGIVARYFDPLLEQNVLLVAGIGEMGTAAASEFVTEERFAREILQGAPRGWNNGNFEIVLNTPVVDGHPGPPRIIASTYW